MLLLLLLDVVGVSDNLLGDDLEARLFEDLSLDAGKYVLSKF